MNGLDFWFRERSRGLLRGAPHPGHTQGTLDNRMRPFVMQYAILYRIGIKVGYPENSNLFGYFGPSGYVLPLENIPYSVYKSVYGKKKVI